MIIAGSRGISLSVPAVCDILRTAGYTRDRLWAEHKGLKYLSEVVSGDARGVDSSGWAFAYQYDVPIRHFPADWDKHGKAAGPIRNKEMAQYADELVLVWDGESRGSAHMKSMALAYFLPVYEVIMKGWL